MQKIALLKQWLAEAEAVLVGAGAGLSEAAGLTCGGERFRRYFSDFSAEYGFRDAYAGGFYPFPSPEAYWAFWARNIYYNRYARQVGQPYFDLLAALDGKEYFVLTTNVDHCFRDAGFEKARLFYTQGDYGLFQCSVPCRQRTYENEAAVREMVRAERNLRVPTALLPRCPVCGKPMVPNLRIDGTFAEDDGWHAARRRFAAFADVHKHDRILYLELGVGMNTPSVIKYPFWRMTAQNKNARYACVSLDAAFAPAEIASRSLCLAADLKEVLSALRAE